MNKNYILHKYKLESIRLNHISIQARLLFNNEMAFRKEADREFGERNKSINN